MEQTFISSHYVFQDAVMFFFMSYNFLAGIPPILSSVQELVV